MIETFFFYHFCLEISIGCEIGFLRPDDFFENLSRPVCLLTTRKSRQESRARPIEPASNFYPILRCEVDFFVFGPSDEASVHFLCEYFPFFDESSRPEEVHGFGSFFPFFVLLFWKRPLPLQLVVTEFCKNKTKIIFKIFSSMYNFFYVHTTHFGWHCKLSLYNGQHKV